MRVPPEMPETLEAQAQEAVEELAALQGLVGAEERVEAQEVQGSTSPFLMGILGLQAVVAVAQEPLMMAPLRAAQWCQGLLQRGHLQTFLQLEAVGEIHLTTTYQQTPIVLRMRLVIV
jgi:hypothetical protein